jgi:hypothetical protein
VRCEHTRGKRTCLSTTKLKEEEHLHPFFHFRRIEKVVYLVITALVLIKCLFYPNALDVLILAGLLVLVILEANGKKF